MRSNQVGRREFITLIGGAAATWPLAAAGQQSTKTYRVVTVHSAPVTKFSDISTYHGFTDEMHRLGYVDGRSLFIERRSSEGKPELFGGLAQK
jgi:putative tryptophan/tyrosine transport system substrate-binding protein